MQEAGTCSGILPAPVCKPLPCGVVTARVPQELGKILQAPWQLVLGVNFLFSVGEVIVLVRQAGHCY